jgi:hypothetical protein
MGSLDFYCAGMQRGNWVSLLGSIVGDSRMLITVGSEGPRPFQIAEVSSIRVLTCTWYCTLVVRLLSNHAVLPV